MKPVVYTSEQHQISQENISPNALKVLYVLNEAGYEACLVGGAVRDLLLGKKPKDFDIATNAHPEQIKRLFRNCRLIGRRFRLAHILFGKEVVEVATFRASDSHAGSGENLKRSTNTAGFLVRDNAYGTMEEDALRRDFTINALYYDAIREEIIDYCSGVPDLKKRIIRLIGDPEVRFREDPVRMLRAIRFEVLLGFVIDLKLITPISNLGYLLQEVSAARMFDEVIKLLLTGLGVNVYERLRHYKLFGQIFPQTEHALCESNDPDMHLLVSALKNSDRRYAAAQGVSPYFLYASLLWAPYQDELRSRLNDNLPMYEAAFQSGRAVLARQCQYTLISKRYAMLIEELWVCQQKLLDKKLKGRSKFMVQPRFKAAFDFLLLRAEAAESGEVIAAAQYWQEKWLKFNQNN